GLGLAVSELGGRVEDLTLEVGSVDAVVVHDPNASDAGRGEIEGSGRAVAAHTHNAPAAGGGEIEGRGRAEAAGTDQEDAGLQQLLLPLEADLGDQQVAAVARDFLVVERARGARGVAG